MKRPEGWHVPVRREDVPETGLHLEIEADEEVRVRLAALRASWRAAARHQRRRDAPRRGVARGGTRHRARHPGLRRHPRAHREYDRRAFRRAVPAARCRRCAPGPARTRSTTPASRSSTAPPISGRSRREFFLLGIDPYPRKPGAVFAGPAEDRAADGPFASLSRLKGRDGAALRRGLPDRNRILVRFAASR